MQPPTRLPPGVYRSQWPPTLVQAPGALPGVASRQRVGYMILIGLIGLAAVFLVTNVLFGSSEAFGKVWIGIWNVAIATALGGLATQWLDHRLAPLAWLVFALLAVNVVALQILVWGDWAVFGGRNEGMVVAGKTAATSGWLAVTGAISGALLKYTWKHQNARTTAIAGSATLAIAALAFSVIIWTETANADLWRMVLALTVLGLAGCSIAGLMARMDKPGA